MRDFIRFKAEVKKQLTLRGWTYKDLQVVTGYTYKTIEKFMCGKYGSNGDFVGKAIAKALDIPEHMAT